MQVNIRLGEPFWRSVGERDLLMTIQPQSTLAALIAELCRRYPALTEDLIEAPPVYFIDDSEVDVNAPVTDGCRVHLVWPITGG